MKERQSAFATAIETAAACLSVMAVMLLFGCNGNAALTASKANGALTLTVDQAMTGWAAYTQSHTVPSSSILAVSNAYTAYYNAELTLSNLTALYIESPTTNVASAMTTAMQGISQSQTNLSAIISALTTK